MLSIELMGTSDWSKQDGQCITHIRLDTTLLSKWLYPQTYRLHLFGNDERIHPKHLEQGSDAVATEQSLLVANMQKVPKSKIEMGPVAGLLYCDLTVCQLTGGLNSQHCIIIHLITAATTRLG